MLLRDDEKREIRNHLFDFIDRNCLFRPNPNKNDEKIRYKYHLDRVLHNPLMLSVASRLMFDEIISSISENQKVQLVGVGESSTPLIAAIQMTGMLQNVPLNSFLITSEGVKGIVEETPAIFIDVLMKEDEAIESFVQTLQKGKKFNIQDTVFSIISQMKEDGRVKINSIFSCHEFSKMYTKEKYWEIES
jgi:hypothetical protein